MKNALTIAAIVAIAGTLTAVSAEDAARPIEKAPTKTMGDEGKLPATSTGTDAVLDMTGPRSAASPAESDANSDASSPKGPPTRMGDEGKLPATSTGTNAVPDMTGK